MCNSKTLCQLENKNKVKPLKSMGQSPGVRLPLWPYKSELLTSKPKAFRHLLAEGFHPLQDDKHEINLLLEEIHSI